MSLLSRLRSSSPRLRLTRRLSLHSKYLYTSFPTFTSYFSLRYMKTWCFARVSRILLASRLISVSCDISFLNSPHISFVPCSFYPCLVEEEIKWSLWFYISWSTWDAYTHRDRNRKREAPISSSISSILIRFSLLLIYISKTVCIKILIH